MRDSSHLLHFSYIFPGIPIEQIYNSLRLLLFALIRLPLSFETSHDIVITLLINLIREVRRWLPRKLRCINIICGTKDGIDGY